MADVPFATNLLPQYQSPQMMAQAAANTANVQANTGLMGAQTGLLGAQTQGQGLQNQVLQSQLGYRQQLPASMAAAAQSSTPPAPGSLEDGGLTPDQIQAHANAKFYVSPAWTPQEATAMNNAMLSGQPGAIDAVKTMHDMRVQNLQTQATNAATNSYDNAYQVQNAPKGAALATLDRGGPEAQSAAAHIESMAEQKGWTPEQTDQHVRDFATEIGGSSFAFSKYATDAKRDTDGVLKDVRGRPVIESTQAGVSAPTQASLAVTERGQNIGANSANISAVGAISPLKSQAMTVASIARQSQQLDQVESYLDQQRSALGSSARTSQIKIESLSPTIRSWVTSNNLVGQGGVVQLAPLIAAANSQSAQLDAAVQKNENVSGSMGSDSRAGMTAAATTPLDLGDNDQTWQSKLNMRRLQRAGVNDLASGFLTSTNNQITGIINNANKNGANLKPGDFTVSTPTPQKLPETAKTVQTPGGASEGATSLSKSGKPIVFTNGHWQYK